MVYVDDAEVQKHGYAWFHLVADSVQELHEFAASIGLPARAFHRGARHPDVVAEVLVRAQGSCERCHQPAPFLRRSDGTPYLEVHHLIPLGTVENQIQQIRAMVQ